MLRRLIAWCVPEKALELRVDPPEQPEKTDVERALAPYKSETSADPLLGLRIVGNP